MSSAFRVSRVYTNSRFKTITVITSLFYSIKLSVVSYYTQRSGEDSIKHSKASVESPSVSFRFALG